MIKLEEVQNYYRNRCKVFPKLLEVNSKLTQKDKQILYEIGLPNHHGIGGDYIILKELQLLGEQYLQIATKKYQEENFKLCIDLDTNKVVFTYGKYGNYQFHIMNTNLEAYLKYIYVDERFRLETIMPDALGDYYIHHEKYSKELKRRLLEINNDVNFGSWDSLIEEMELGVI